MKVALDELERKARAARATWWVRGRDTEMVIGGEEVPRFGSAGLHLGPANVDHIAANSPEVTLALIARIRELETERDRAFVAGYDAGWESTGEGKNSEHTSPRYTQERYEAERSEALAAFAKGKP